MKEYSIIVDLNDSKMPETVPEATNLIIIRPYMRDCNIENPLHREVASKQNDILRIVEQEAMDEWVHYPFMIKEDKDNIKNTGKQVLDHILEYYRGRFPKFLWCPGNGLQKDIFNLNIQEFYKGIDFIPDYRASRAPFRIGMIPVDHIPDDIFKKYKIFDITTISKNILQHIKRFEWLNGKNDEEHNYFCNRVLSVINGKIFDENKSKISRYFNVVYPIVMKQNVRIEWKDFNSDMKSIQNTKIVSTAINSGKSVTTLEFIANEKVRHLTISTK